MWRFYILFLSLVFPIAATAQSEPSIILITLDTVRADRMGFLGSRSGLTPQIDSLARQGVVFAQTYSQAPLTPVSHATILSGTYPRYHGVRDFGSRLPDSIPYLPETLHARGYRTAAFVSSIILDPKNGFSPGFERGFEVYDAGFHRAKRGEKRSDSMQRRGEETTRGDNPDAPPDVEYQNCRQERRQNSRNGRLQRAAWDAGACGSCGRSRARIPDFNGETFAAACVLRGERLARGL